MIRQNRFSAMLFNNTFDRMNSTKYYKDVFKYYGYNQIPNSVVYPIPIIKYSKTFTKQASLPRLPIPQLETTLNKYLIAIKSLVDNTEFEKAKHSVDEFKKPNGIGEQLQKLLYERSLKYDNWLAQWWLDKVYLEPRYPITINVSPNILYPKANYKNMNEQLIYATNFIYGFIEYKKLIDTQQLPVEKFGDSPLCMDQYFKIIGSTRLPNKDKDKLYIQQPYLNSPNHITVLYKNRIFNLQIIDSETGQLLNKSEIYTNLKHLVENNQTYCDNDLGIMTSENRDIWAENYEILKKDKQNQDNFNSISNSLFVLCLDHDINVNNDSGKDERSLAAAQLLHGNKIFSSNRWFDKTIQAIIGTNGVCGLSFEHSVAEALVFSKLSDHVLDYIANSEKSLETVNLSDKRFHELKFKISTEVQRAIDKAKLNLYKSIDNLDLLILNFDLFGKNFPKSQKLSPDAFIQIALQLAYYKTHNQHANTYESGSLRKFTLGRTEIIRSLSNPTIEFVKSMDSNNKKSLIERAKLFKDAIKSHNAFTNNVLNFQSFDRHLMGLKLTALENKFELPSLYNDVAFKQICHYNLSTSQVSSKHNLVCSFGPAVNDGYGICYNTLEKQFLFGISAFKTNKDVSVTKFAENLKISLSECQNILANISSKL